MHRHSYWFSGVILLIALLLAGCNLPAVAGNQHPTVTIQSVAQPAVPSITKVITKPTLPPPSQTASPTHTNTPPPSATSTPAPTATYTPSPTFTFTPGPTPTYAILRGEVLEQANCRYGPGAAYLYKYGLYPGFNIEIFGRNDTGTWITIRAIGGTNPCWVKASLLNIKGDVMSVAPTELPLPMSPYYGPLSGVFAERKGDEVIISWNAMQLRAGDDSLQYPYLVEAWLCQAGQLSFNPIGSWETIVIVKDEAGCSQPSHARVYGVEKHGYTRWVAVPWPAP